jgi:hypothetical protein
MAQLKEGVPGLPKTGAEVRRRFEGSQEPQGPV